jgi:phosphoribosylglycinamide formyltransferase-1
VRGWEGKLINIHPSLLPAYKGTKVHERVIAAKEALSGASVHFVVPVLDAGPVIAQAKVPVHPSDTPQTLADRVLAVEHKLYPEALTLWHDKVKFEQAEAVFLPPWRHDGGRDAGRFQRHWRLGGGGEAHGQYSRCAKPPGEPDR